MISTKIWKISDWKYMKLTFWNKKCVIRVNLIRKSEKTNSQPKQMMIWVAVFSKLNLLKNRAPDQQRISNRCRNTIFRDPTENKIILAMNLKTTLTIEIYISTAKKCVKVWQMDLSESLKDHLDKLKSEIRLTNFKLI